MDATSSQAAAAADQREVAERRSRSRWAVRNAARRSRGLRWGSSGFRAMAALARRPSPRRRDR